MSKSAKTIKLLTYNLFLRPPPIKTNDDDFKNERLNDFLEIMDQFDVICFQEMFQTATFRKQKVIQKAISKGFLFWKDCEAPMFWQGPPVDSGLLVISKFPILDSRFESYHVGILSDSASDKGYIYCKIEVKGKILHLFTTHLQASYLHPGMLFERQLSIKTRLYQFKTLLKKIKQILGVTRKTPNQELVLLMGDLNMNSLMCPMTLHGSVLENQKVGKLFIEYDTIIKIFNEEQIKPVNCAFQNYQKHPVTFGDGDTVLTDRLQSLSKQALDYIFHLEVPVCKTSCANNTELDSAKNIKSESENSVSTSNGKCLKPIIGSTKVEQFYVKDKTYTQLSDHYGISIQVQYQ